MGLLARIFASDKHTSNSEIVNIKRILFCKFLHDSIEGVTVESRKVAKRMVDSFVEYGVEDSWEAIPPMYRSSQLAETIRREQQMSSIAALRAICKDAENSKYKNAAARVLLKHFLTVPLY